MKKSIMHVVVKTPAQCSGEEIEEFVRLLKCSETMFIQGIEKRVLSAYLLALLYDNNKVVGCMGLKNPSSSYVEDLESYTGISLRNYPLEIGWLFIQPPYRHQGLSEDLRSSLLSFAQNIGIFTTVDNEAKKAHNILIHHNFKKIGSSYKSSLSGKNLQLFVKKS